MSKCDGFFPGHDSFAYFFLFASLGDGRESVRGDSGVGGVTANLTSIGDDDSGFPPGKGAVEDSTHTYVLSVC